MPVIEFNTEEVSQDIAYKARRLKIEAWLSAKKYNGYTAQFISMFPEYTGRESYVRDVKSGRVKDNEVLSKLESLIDSWAAL